MPVERVLDLAARLHDAGAQEIGFGDTTGMANPRQVGSSSLGPSRPSDRPVRMRAGMRPRN